MRIRVTEDVDIETHFDIKPDSQTPIAPLIFISLIEMHLDMESLRLITALSTSA